MEISAITSRNVALPTLKVHFEHTQRIFHQGMMATEHFSGKVVVFMMITLLNTKAFATSSFRFNGSFYTTSPPSFASLDEKEEIQLPTHFILCSSHKQANFNDV